MRLNPQVSTFELYEICEWFNRKFGRKFLRRLKMIGEEQQKNPFYSWHAAIQFPIEVELRSALQAARDREINKFYQKYSRSFGFLAGIYRISENLNRAPRERFERHVSGLLGDSQGLLPLSCEIDAATHFSQRGFDFDFADFNSTNRFDFLVRIAGFDVEVECKSISSEKGARIKSQQMVLLGKHLRALSEQIVRSGEVRVVYVHADCHLPNDFKGLSILGEEIIDCIRRNTSTKGRYGSVESASFGEMSQLLDEPNEYTLRSVFPNALGGIAQNIIFHGSKGGGKFIVGISSTLDSGVVDGIYEVVKSAADQFTGARPSVVWIQMPALTEPELTELMREESALYGIAGRLWKEGRRDHVNQIVSTSPSNIEKSNSFNLFHMRGAAGNIPNANPKYSVPDLDNLFCVRDL